ncbi:hypothetical protein V8E54_010426 [Elaphomyces granulatus]
MTLPSFAPVPPVTVRKSIPNEEWEAYMRAWVTLIETLLKLVDKAFTAHIVKDESMVSFLSSYFRQVALSNDPSLVTGPRARSLQRSCFILTRRVLLEMHPPPQTLLGWEFLGDLNTHHRSSTALKTLMSEVWDKHQEEIMSSFERGKSLIIKRHSLSGAQGNQELMVDIRRLTVLALDQPTMGQALMTGSDYLDTLMDVYKAQKSGELRQIIVANVYVGFISLLKDPKPNFSLLLDHIFSLKSAAETNSGGRISEPTLLSDLICSSDVLMRIERSLAGSSQKRGQGLIASLRIYQSQMKSFHRRYQRHKKRRKGKDRADDGIPDADILHNKSSLIKQIQDLFPNFGSGYVSRLLDYYEEDAELAISHILENSLPPELQLLDQSEELSSVQSIIDVDNPLSQLNASQNSPPPEPDLTRRNVFDDDIVELARSGDGAHKLHFGRADPDLTADAILADRSQHAVNKAAIISALATFDSDDDEHDDTYDIADVGGTVDSLPVGIDADADDTRNIRAVTSDEAQVTLFRLFKSNPGLFARDSATRRSQPRLALKRETGMTDEAIEGWAVMLARDPKRESRLERNLALVAGGTPSGGTISQRDFLSTAYRKPNSTSEEATEDSGEASDAPAVRSGGNEGGNNGRGRGRGRGRGNRGRGDRNVAGVSGDRETAIARQRKDASKASRANHNRRDRRAKKIGAGMMPI